MIFSSRSKDATINALKNELETLRSEMLDMQKEEFALQMKCKFLRMQIEEFCRFSPKLWLEYFSDRAGKGSKYAKVEKDFINRRKQALESFHKRLEQ